MVRFANIAGEVLMSGATRKYCLYSCFAMTNMLFACKLYTKFLLCLACAIIILGITSGQECSKGLGMENSDIPDSRITASSYATIDGTSYLPDLARLNAAGETWISNKTDQHPWIQVDLGMIKSVSGLIIQGYDTRWVKEFTVKIGDQDDSLVSVKDDDSKPQTFHASVHHDEVDVLYTVLFEPILLARVIRIEPQICQLGREIDQNCAMRFEVLGCEDPVQTIHTEAPDMPETPGSANGGGDGLTMGELLGVILGPIATVVVALIGMITAYFTYKANKSKDEGSGPPKNPGEYHVVPIK